MNKGAFIRKHKPDYPFIVSFVLLIGLGLVIIYSVSPALAQQHFQDVTDLFFFYRHFIYAGLGIVAFSVMSFLKYDNLKKIAPYLLVLALLASLLVIIPGIGRTVNGATRWIGLGPFSFQPAEVLKLAVVIMFAKWLSTKEKSKELQSTDSLKRVFMAIAVLGFVIVILQKDMGTMLVFSAIMVTMYFMSTAKFQHVGYLIGALASAGALGIIFAPHRLQRLMTFLRPESDTMGAGYHINQALIALGSGGMFGLGIGDSIQVYGYLPESANDSIFAVFGEKFGFIGSILIIGLYAFMLWRIYHIANRAPDKFSQYLSVGVLAWISSHVVINIGAMVALMPLTGITLPFISYGGTSLVIMAVALGIVFNISKYTTQRSTNEDSRNRRRNRRSHYAYSGGSTASTG